MYSKFLSLILVFHLTKIYGQPKRADILELYPFLSENRLYGFIDRVGTVVIAPQFDRADSLRGLARVQRYGKWGVIDFKGNLVFQTPADLLGCVPDGPFLIGFYQLGTLRTKWLFVGENGHLTGQTYDSVRCYSEGIASVSKDGKAFYVDLKENPYMNRSFEEADSFSEGLARIVLNGRTGYVDGSGTVVISEFYADGKKFSEGVAAVAQILQSGLKWGFIDKKGEMLIPPQFDDARSFSEGLAAVRVGFRWGFIDKRGHMVISPKYHAANDFSQNLAAVESSSEWGSYGYIDHGGVLRIPSRFAKADSFGTEGIARVEPYVRFLHSRPGGSLGFGYVNTKGIVIWSSIPQLMPLGPVLAAPVALAHRPVKNR